MMKYVPYNFFHGMIAYDRQQRRRVQEEEKNDQDDDESILTLVRTCEDRDVVWLVRDYIRGLLPYVEKRMLSDGLRDYKYQTLYPIYRCRLNFLDVLKIDWRRFETMRWRRAESLQGLCDKTLDTLNMHMVIKERWALMVLLKLRFSVRFRPIEVDFSYEPLDATFARYAKVNHIDWPHDQCTLWFIMMMSCYGDQDMFDYVNSLCQYFNVYKHYLYRFMMTKQQAYYH